MLEEIIQEASKEEEEKPEGFKAFETDDQRPYRTIESEQSHKIIKELE